MTGDPPGTVRAAVAAMRPAWTLRAAEPVGVGTDSLHYVTAGTPQGTRDCVLKLREAVPPPAFRPEPYLLWALGDRTGVPVPPVAGTLDEHPRLPPSFLTGRCSGERPPETGGWRPAVARRVAREAGRFAGEYHRVGEFERFGAVRLGRDVAHGRSGVAVGGRRVTTADGAGTWRGFLGDFVDRHLARLDGRFADLRAPLRAFFAERLDAAAGAPGPALAHPDYRPWNLLLGPEDRTAAVLDWGEAFTADPHYDLVSTEQHLSRWAPLDGRLRGVVRAALRSGYRETNRLPRPAGFGRRRELYLAATRLPGLVYFPSWAETVPAPEVERAARTHRAYVAGLVS